MHPWCPSNENILCCRPNFNKNLAHKSKLFEFKVSSAEISLLKKTHGPHELGKCRTVHVNVEFCVNKGVKYLTGGSIESEISISFRQFRSWEVMSFQCNCKVFCNLNWTFENWIKTLLLTDGHLKGNKTLRYSKTLILKYWLNMRRICF